MSPARVPFGTDAAHISGLGYVPCVVLGPGSIDQAHTGDEWVAIEKVERAVELNLHVIDQYAVLGA